VVRTRVWKPEKLFDSDHFKSPPTANLVDPFVNTTVRTETKLRDHYDALRAKGINHKDAKVSLARKIAGLTLSLLKNNDTYNDNYEEHLEERKKLRILVGQTKH